MVIFNMCIFHKWDKWQQYDVNVPERVLSSRWMLSGATSHMQKRKCKKCGKLKVQHINITVR